MNYLDFIEHLEKMLHTEIKNSKLIEQALIHPSYANEINDVNYHYERLEFIGDAILEFLISEYIYLHYPKLDEGKLTVLRAKVVCENSLFHFADYYSLQDYIKVGHGERKADGNNKKSVKANVFEAVLGALYLSNGLAVASLFLGVIFKAIEEDEFVLIQDYKTKLQEYFQADTKRSVSYECLDVKGNANNPTFTFMAKIDNLVLGTGSGSSKKAAQQEAAKNALEKMAKL